MIQRRKQAISLLITLFVLVSVFALPAIAMADGASILREADEQSSEPQQTPPAGDVSDTDAPESTPSEEGSEDGVPDATPVPSPTPTPSQWDVHLEKGECVLLDAHGEIFGKLTIINDDDYIAAFTPDASSSLSEGNVSIRFRPAGTAVLSAFTLGQTNVYRMPVWIEYSESSKQAGSFQAWLDRQSIRNFEELVVAYQSVQQAQEEQLPRNESLPVDGSDAQSQPNPTSTAPAAPLSGVDDADKTNVQKLGLLEILMLALLGISVLLGVFSLMSGLLRARRNEELLNSNYNNLARVIKELVGNTTSNKTLTENMNAQIAEIKTILKQRPQGGVSVLPIDPYKPPRDPVADFLAATNALTRVSARQSWYSSLAQHYQVQFAQYDAINRRFYVVKDEQNPPFAVCHVLDEVFLIPSCYDSGLQAADLLIIYDIVSAAGSASTYRIDKAAKLQPYGAYYTVVSKGRITLLS